ncbi:MAG TPA: filamentous hemagglutinin N-terminal domain-containing protein, partial [Acidimicrobiales bacterium]
MPAAVLAGLMIAGPAAALPQGGEVVSGKAAISQVNASTLQIQQFSANVIINWKGFSVGANELVRFLQPGAMSVAVNRVVGGGASTILGQITANGRIILNNPSGISFGPGSLVNVGGLVATTLNMKDFDPVTGRYIFQQGPGGLGTIINQGTLTAAPGGFIALSAPAVVNQGTISAQLGTVSLSSGQQLTVDFTGDGLVRFAVDGALASQPMGPDGRPLSSRVSNDGRIQADGGRVELTAKAAGDVLSSVVNNSGIIQARSMVNQGGVVRLIGGDDATAVATASGAVRPAGVVAGAVTNSGTIDVSAAERGAAPGQVTMLGERVGQMGTIDARGADQARGGDVTLTSTERTILFGGSTIDASGRGSSDGGRVTVWSDKDTTAASGARILSRGGEAGGNGGFVEVSGKESLGFAASVDTLAPLGKTGTLLLDPMFLVVSNAGVAYNAGVNNLYANTPAGTNTITPASINALATNATLQANTDVTITDPIAMANAGVTLTMQAGRSVLINNNVSTNNGAISVTSNDPGALLANRTAGAGSITMATGTTLNAGTQQITLSTGNLAGGNPGDITAANLNTTGNVLINSLNNVTLTGALKSGGPVTINANADGAGAQSFTMNAGSSIATTDATAAAVGINVNATAGGTGTAALRDISTGSGGTIAVATNTGGNVIGGSITQAAGTLLNTSGLPA